MLFEHAKKEIDYLNAKIRQLETEIAQLPEGSLFCSKNGSQYKWYTTRSGTTMYLAKENRNLARQLAKRKYLTNELEAFLQEKKAVESYLRKCEHGKYQKKRQKLMENAEFHMLLEEILFTENEQIKKWISQSYETNPKMPEQKVHKTYQGVYVRSKSEVLISNTLFTNQIPFRYENLIQIQDIVLYPDFTILHPRTGKIYYWEHFGMMDDEAYMNSFLKKIKLYQSEGIIPSVQLIMTFETKQHPLDYEYVQNLVNYYFA